MRTALCFFSRIWGNHLASLFITGDSVFDNSLHPILHPGILSFEGLYYAVGTIITSAVLGVLLSVAVVRGISNGIWFFTYQFAMWPMLAV